MQNSASLLSLLRENPGILKSEPRKERLRFPLLPEGVPRGAVVELSGTAGGGKTEAALQLLAAHPSLRVAWIEEELTVYPCAFPQSGVNLERVLFIEEGPTSGHTLWTTHQLLKAGLFGVVVLSAPSFSQLRTQLSSEVTLRRLQIASEKAFSTLVLLTETPLLNVGWPLSLQLRVARDPVTGRIVTNVLKSKTPLLAAANG